MSPRFTAALATLAVTACGRLGFDGHTGSPDPLGGDAAPDGDTGLSDDSPVMVDALAAPSDATVAARDATAPPADASGGADASSECARPAPFLHLIRVVASNNGSTQTALYCSAGIAGTLDATIRRSGSGSSKFAEVTAPVASGQVVFAIGSAACLGCFVRLEAGGLEDNGPVTDFVGQ